MKRRLMAVLMACVMTLSLLPISALATDSVFDNAQEAQTATNVVATKTISGPDANGCYDIKLTVQGTTSQSSSTNNLPADVVLVLDTSGSMAFCSQPGHEHDWNCYAECTKKSNPTHWKNSKHITGTDCEYVSYLFGGYYRYLICGQHGHWMNDGNGDGCGNYNDDGTPKAVDDRRITHAKAAAQQFVNGLLAEGSKIQVGLADFSGANHVAKELTQNSGVLTDAINSLTAAHSDGTSYTAGLWAAQSILQNGKNQQKFVVFISDGEPNNGNYGTDIANQLKNNGVTIMSVGIGLSEAEAKYLKAICSDGMYYGTSAAGLSSILATLKETITSTIYAGTGAVMTDIINTDNFDLVGSDEKLASNGDTLTWNIDNIGKDMQEVHFQVKLKEDNTDVGELFTNKNVNLSFKSSVLEQDVTFTENAIGKPSVKVYSVTYTDGVEGEEVFADQASYNQLEGIPTPGFIGTPERENYEFKGWSPQVAPRVGGDAYAIVYTAQWELSTHSVTGTIDGNGTVANGNQPSVKHNEACTDMVFTPNLGYKIASVTVNNVPETNFVTGEGGTYTYSNEHVTENIEVVVTTEIDDGQTKDLSYTVEYYKDGVKVDADTQTVTKTVQVLEPNTLTVDRSKINTTDKYYGYKLEKTDPAPIPESIEDKGTIKVYYVKDDGKTKDLSYTVEYYKDGEKVDTDTQTETKTVQVLEPDTLTVNKSKINTTDKYYGYKLEKTEPAPIPESIEDKGVIKVYYVKDDGQTQQTKYTVHYTIEGVEQENDKVEVEGSAWINDEPAMIAIAEGGIPTPSNKYNGYKPDPANPEYPAAGTPVESGSEYTVNYVKRTDLSYTVHYYLKDTTTKLADDKVVIDQTFGAAVTEKALDIAGYNVFGESEKTITIGVGANEIIFYYTRVVYPYVPVVKPALNRDDHYAYVVGYPDGMVRPSGNITRAEAATIFFRLLTDDSRNQFWMTTNTYSDVNRGDWFNNAVSTLSNAGIISGYPDGTFRPNAPITRAEMSKIIALFAKLNKSEDRFNDIAGHWAEAYIKLAAGNGWIAGYPDGSFKPQQNITRAETMTMINRVLERVPSVESHLLPYNAMLTFPDCQSGQWFYIAVQEATNSHTYERAASEKNGDEQWIALRANRDWTQFQN